MPLTSSNAGSEITRARTADINALAALSIEVWLDTYATDGIPDSYASHVLQAYAPQVFTAVLQSPDKHLIVCRNSVGLLGYLKLDLKARPVENGCGSAEIETLYVRRHHQGRGVGTRLLEAASCLARDAGHSKLFLTVYEGNRKAIGFYEAQGMVTEGHWTFDFEGGSVPNLIMTWDVSAPSLSAS
ncbi:N-acetyltransferase family protein [Roseibium sp. LAB1]